MGNVILWGQCGSQVGLVESRLLNEVKQGGSNTNVMEYVNVLEKIAEQQKALPVAFSSNGKWDLAYSSLPPCQFLSFSSPKWLSHFLVSFSATVDMDGKSIIYRTIYRFFFSWFVLRRMQQASIQPMSPSSRRSVEILGQPRFTLGRLFSWVLPRRADRDRLVRRLVNNCTYLGSNLKICRITRPTVSSEPSVAVFLRTNPTTQEVKEKHMDEQIVKIDQLFKRRENRRPPQTQRNSRFA